MRIPFTIDSIFEGLSATQNFTQKGGFTGSIGIDPDMPINNTDTRISGYLRPTSTEKISSTTITNAPLWLVSNPKDTNIYVYDAGGKTYTLDTSLTVTALNSGTALTTASGNGADYYDNYLYFTKNTDVCRYGPLNGSPSFNQTYWTSTLSKTALVDTTYPTIRGQEMPNHVMHRHTDNKIYFCDVTTANKGVLHYIKTSKTTVEGDTDDGSSHTALDFGYGYYPTTLETYETQLVVALMEGTATGVKQKPAALTFWDTTSTTFEKIIQIEFPDPIITALKNINGALYVWSGNANGGVRLSRFYGGYSYEELFYFEDGYPPLQGAVDGEMNRITWGGVTSYPEASVSVFARGSRSAKLGTGVHNILKTTSGGANGFVSCLKYIQTTSNALRQPIVGWKDDSGQGLDKSSTTYGTSVWRSEVFRVGRPFQIRKLRIPLAQAVGADMTATVKIYSDNGSTSETIATINNTNYPNSERLIAIYPQAKGQQDFFIEIRWTGSALMTVALPITGIIETVED
jgi:hypothetical protein